MWQLLSEFHKHIDNGGVTINVTQGPDFDIRINMNTAYFGHPAVSASLHGTVNLNKEDLKNIGMMFLQAANNYKTLEEK